MLRTDNVRVQISEHISAPTEAIVYLNVSNYSQGPRSKCLSGGAKEERVDKIVLGGMLGNFYLISLK